ncbi:MAG TPA: 3-deoxy-D-manno-octulosonic acid transferase [Rhizomicrobium sp.]|jgi:3-deoxy-D-manno-octulosonic-acid transferase
MTAESERMTGALLAYRAATSLFLPIGHLALLARARSGKEELPRLSERFGRASRARPAGQLIWIHGASIGECLSVLPLIDKLLENPDRRVLVTSGTVTSAALMRQRLPQRAFHQYAPIDAPSPVARFFDHWRPDAALFVDSELWPNLLLSARGRGLRVALINARMSARAYAGWKRAPRSAAGIMGCFDMCLAQNEESEARLRQLGAKDVRMFGNLKADAPPESADPEKLTAMEQAVAGRPILLAASTHPGEDETILPAYDALRSRHPDLLTIIAPRHPDRGAEIAMLCGTRNALRRSEGFLPRSDTAVYVADTIGELPLLYRIAQFAFVGGSLVGHGGQNPLEAAKLERAVMAGPHTENFTAAYQSILAAQGTGRVHCCAEIVDTADRWLTDRDAARAAGIAAAQAAAALGGALEKTHVAIEAMLAHAPA